MPSHVRFSASYPQSTLLSRTRRPPAPSIWRHSRGGGDPEAGRRPAARRAPQGGSRGSGSSVAARTRGSGALALSPPAFSRPRRTRARLGWSPNTAPPRGPGPRVPRLSPTRRPPASLSSAACHESSGLPGGHPEVAGTEPFSSPATAPRGVPWGPARCTWGVVCDATSSPSRRCRRPPLPRNRK